MSIRVVGDYGTMPYYLMPEWTLKFIMGTVTMVGPDVWLDIQSVEVDAGPPLLGNPARFTWSGQATPRITRA